MTQQPQLRTVTRTQGNNAALKSGEVVSQSFTLAFEEVPVLVQAFRRMVRGLDFDVCEMALTTYLVAKAYGVRFTALPVFLVRGFHHGATQILAGSGIRCPKDLEGRRVGVNRGYTVTTGVWARAVLQEEHGVDLESISWALSGDEHVAAYRPPDNATTIEPGQNLEELLRSGELAAVIGADIDAPDVAPLIADADQAGFVSLQERGHYPINHLVVVKDEVLEANPQVAADVFDAFARSKALYVEQLRAGTLEAPTAADRTYARVMDLTGADPLPYGLDPNRGMLEELMRHAVDQSILERPMDLDGLFAEGTQGRTA